MPQFYQINNLTGGINSVAEENALRFIGSPVAEARDIENFVPLSRGGQQKTRGFELFRSLGTTDITGLYRFSKSNGVSVLLGGCQGKIYSFTATTQTDLLITVNPTAPLHFETALDKCLICDGVGTVQSYDGLTTTALSSGTPNILLGSKQTLFYQNRIWVYGNAGNPSLLYYSNPNDVANGYDTQFVNCDTNDGQKITAVARFFIPGMLEPVILVGKERSMGIITGDGSSGNPYTFAKINQNFGVAHHRQVVSYAQSVVFYTSQGVYLCQSDLQNLNLHFQKLSDPVQNLLNALPASKQMGIVAFQDWQRDRLGFAVAELGQTANNLIYHYDTRLNSWYKERWATGQTCTCCWVDADGTWYHGDSQGKVYIHSQVDHFAGQPITAVYKTPFLDFNRPQQLKQLMEVQLTLRGNGNYSLLASTTFDFGSRSGKSTVLNLTAGQYKWNAGMWTSNPAVYKWGSSAIGLKRFYPASLFRQVQFTFTQTGINQPVDLFGLNFMVT
jgi:hypothetical protein